MAVRKGLQGVLMAGRSGAFVLVMTLCLGRGRADSPVLRWSGNGHYYQFVDSWLSWTDAKADAEAAGGYLVTITSQDEQQFIVREFVTPYMTPYTKLCWIGLYQDHAPYPGAWAPDEHWHWVTGEPVVYTNWRQAGPKEPNDSPSPQEDNQENYAHLHDDSDGTWNDLRVAWYAYIAYIVEWDSDPPAPAPPTLSWSGEPGFASDGVDPDVGTPGQTLHRYRVELTDPDGDEPDYVRVIIWKDGVRYLNRRMRPVRGAGPTISGRIYKFSLRDPLPPGTYEYHFRARDDDGFASGPPTDWQSGPSMLPELLFGTAPGLEDGVRPNTGTADGTVFFWKVIYRDGDGDPAKFVRVLVWRDGSFYNVFRMVNRDPEPDPKAGVVYRARRRLTAGSYEYRFEAEDKDGRAVGPASVKMSGLTVTAAAPLTLTSLSAVPTNTGTQITFSLSSAAQVQARILNIAGRPVKTLCHARDCEAGTNTLLWNARSDSGLAVPNGTYLVEVTAKAGDGTQTRAVGYVTIR